MLGSEIPVKIFSSDARTSSEESSLPDELRHQLARELEEDRFETSGDTLAAIAQQYEDAEGFGGSTLRATAERVLRARQYSPSSVHELLASLPFPLIITTGQDAAMANALKSAGKSPITQRYHLRSDKRDNPEFVIPGNITSPVIYHLFGYAADPSSLVISENDILDFLIAVVSQRPPLPNSLLSALKRVGQSFLFIGFGIKQWDLRVLLKVLLRSLELNRSGPVIAAEPLSGLLQPDRDQMILFYQRGTRVELEDDDIAMFLKQLSTRFEADGGYIEEAPVLGTRPKVFISYVHEDNSLASRVYDALQKAEFEPWLDQESIKGGEDWNQRIEADLDASDFTLVLYTRAFCRKTDSYVNKEVALATERALRVRGSFLIPLRGSDVVDSERVEALNRFGDMQLSPPTFEQDMSKVISTMKREYQRRQR